MNQRPRWRRRALSWWQAARSSCQSEWPMRRYRIRPACFTAASRRPAATTTTTTAAARASCASSTTAQAELQAERAPHPLQREGAKGDRGAGTCRAAGDAWAGGAAGTVGPAGPAGPQGPRARTARRGSRPAGCDGAAGACRGHRGTEVLRGRWVRQARPGRRGSRERRRSGRPLSRRRLGLPLPGLEQTVVFRRAPRSTSRRTAGRRTVTPEARSSTWRCSSTAPKPPRRAGSRSAAARRWSSSSGACIRSCRWRRGLMRSTCAQSWSRAVATEVSGGPGSPTQGALTLLIIKS